MKGDFKKRMGLEEVDKEEALERFLNRIRVSIFRWLESGENTIFYDENFIWWISEQLGKPWGDTLKRREYGSGYFSRLTLSMMAKGDFYETLEVVEKCYQYIEEGKSRRISGRYTPDYSSLISVDNFNKRMEKIILLSETDIGIFWKDGKFYVSGASELDEALITDQLEWLDSYPDVKNQFSTTLEHYQKSSKKTSAGKDTITNAYTSIEMLCRILLANKKNFDKNSDELVNKLGLPKEYKNVIHWYKQIANEYASRHAGANPSHNEVEMFLYFTGLLIRMIIQSVEK